MSEYQEHSDLATAPRARSRAERSCDVAWEYTIGPEPFDIVDEPVRRLVDVFHPLANVVTDLANRLQARASVTALIRVQSVRPAYVLTAETMRRIVALDAEFSMDLIDLRP